MIKSKKSAKIQQKKFKFNTRSNQTEDNKCIHRENINTIKESIQDNMSDNENSDSSFELLNTKKKFKSKNNRKQKLHHNVNLDYIDLTNEPELKDFKFKNEKKSSLNAISRSPSVYDISSDSNESFKSFSNSLSDLNDRNQDNFNLDKPQTRLFSHNFGSEDYLSDSSHNDKNSICHDNISNSENDCVTPKEKHIKIISESAKLLDRIYGKDWRQIDGVINDPKEKKFSDGSNGNYNKLGDDNELNTSYNNIENSFSYEVLTKNKHQERNFQNEIEDTSLILESISLSDNLNKITDDQLEISSQFDLQTNLKTLTQKYPNECNDLKQISKSKTLKKNGNVRKNIKDDICINQQSNVPHNSEATLSFLSSLSCFTGTMKCDPQAEKYKLKFKKNKDTLVSVLFKLFNKEVFDNKLPADLNFKWNARLRSTAGACFNKRSVKINENLDCERISRIELSSKIIDTTERLRDTLIHELCHAACWIFNGISEGHGPSWKSWANKAMEKFPELPVIKRCHSYDIQTKFTYKCKKCGYSFGRHSKSLNLEKKRCGHCYGEFELIVNKINKNQAPNNNYPVVYTDPLKELYKLNDAQEKPKLPKKPSKFALFVKENYGRMKRENPLLKHGEIMKLLGSKFATTKILTPDEVFDKLLES